MLAVVMLGLAALAAAALLIVAFYFADTFTRPKRRRVQGTPDDVGVRYEEVQFLTSDRVVLRGWYIASPGARATVVLVHDEDTNRTGPGQQMLALQRDYTARGFSTFAFDLRGRGESAGSRDLLGCRERLDVRAAVAYARRRSPDRPVVLHGFGTGASLALDVAAELGDVACVIADSPYASMRTALRCRYPQLPAPVFALACYLARRVFGADVDAVAPIRAMPDLNCPVLFIHAEADELAPFGHTLNLVAASLTNEHEVWRLPDERGHCCAYVQEPREYLSRCLQFIDRTVPIRVLQPLAPSAGEARIAAAG